MAQPSTPGVAEDHGGFTVTAPQATSYRVDLSDNLFAPDNPLLGSYLDGRRVCAFVSTTVDHLYGQRIRAYLSAALPPAHWTVVVLPGGERHKTMASVEAVCTIAQRAGLDRNGVMLAIGGGIICDVVGFAASIYARGVRLIKVNTTLVGQVDVGVGVKTGINAMNAKNILGTYHAPYASINDSTLLATLPPRQIRCGLGEIVKMAVVRDEKLFLTLEENRHLFLGDAIPVGDRVTSAIIRTSMGLMMRELCHNLTETDLARVVDFGHTFSPVIETASDYRIAHGEAVAIDIAMSSHIARLLGLCGAEDCERVVALLTGAGLPVFDAATCRPDLMRDALVAAYQRRGRALNLVVPTGIGAATFVTNLDELPISVVTEALRALAPHGTIPAGTPIREAPPAQTPPPEEIPRATPPAPVRRRLANLDELTRQVSQDHGGDGTIHVYRAFDQARTDAHIEFIDLVRMPPGSSIGLHRHGDDEETYLILDGGGVMTVDGREFRVGRHDMVVNRPYGEHGLRNDTETDLNLLVFEVRPGLRPDEQPGHGDHQKAAAS